LVVPESQNALALLETFKRTGRHMAIVVDEFGVVAGLVTLHDVMEAIIGEFPTMDKRLRPTAKRRDDGSWLIDAMIPIEEFEEAVKDFPLDPVETRDYETFGGLIIRRLGHIPTEGETFVCGPYIVEIIDMDHHRVDKALLLPRPAEKITSPDTSPA
jgi:putative hemolysin